MSKKINDGLTAKQRYFNKRYSEAPLILCACGCGTAIKSIDKYARPVKYENGHRLRKYDDPTQYKREWNHRNREHRQEYKAQYHRTRKIKALEYLGDGCKMCNLKYNGKNAAAFEFHHIDPNSKEFNIGNNLVNKAWNQILKELDKCDLLCSNCHNLIHSAEF